MATYFAQRSLIWLALWATTVAAVSPARADCTCLPGSQKTQCSLCDTRPAADCCCGDHATAEPGRCLPVSNCACNHVSESATKPVTTVPGGAAPQTDLIAAVYPAHVFQPATPGAPHERALLLSAAAPPLRVLLCNWRI